MWTTENRAGYNRDTLRYPSDMTEEEWAEIVSLIPPARRGGRKRSVNIREVFNGLLYVLSTGCQWCVLQRLDGAENQNVPSWWQLRSACSVPPPAGSWHRESR